MPSVIIGPEFFKKEFKEYDDWRWAWVREICQNSIDCGSSNITFEIEEIDGDTHVTVTNDGTPMTNDVLVNKLLALGASGKNFDGTTGGFGKAKNILLFCHKSWSVTTGATAAAGIGGEYELNTIDYFYGTRTHVVMSGEHKDALLYKINKFVNYAQWSGTFHVCGEVYNANLCKGSPRRDLGFGKVYTNKSYSHVVIVRINGIPMFHAPTSFDRCVIVELTGASDQVLTANRDGLLNPYKGELYDFITELAVDKRSALKDRSRGPRYTEYRGTKLCHKKHLDVSNIVHAPQSALVAVGNAIESFDAIKGIDVIGDDSVVDDSDAVSEGGIDTTDYYGSSAGNFVADSPVEERRSVATLGSNFIIKNETDLKIPAYYDPGSGEFSTYSHKLVRIWGRIMLEMHRVFDVSGDFSIGFIFDDTGTEAECEEGSYGLVYYLNPCTVVEQVTSSSKSFKRRFKLTERDRLIAIGAHEFVHCLGYKWHDERYANRLTDVLAVVMRERKRFNWCFK